MDRQGYTFATSSTSYLLHALVQETHSLSEVQETGKSCVYIVYVYFPVGLSGNYIGCHSNCHERGAGNDYQLILHVIDQRHVQEWHEV